MHLFRTWTVSATCRKFLFTFRFRRHGKWLWLLLNVPVIFRMVLDLGDAIISVYYNSLPIVQIAKEQILLAAWPCSCCKAVAGTWMEMLCFDPVKTRLPGKAHESILLVLVMLGAPTQRNLSALGKINSISVINDGRNKQKLSDKSCFLLYCCVFSMLWCHVK